MDAAQLEPYIKALDVVRSFPHQTRYPGPSNVRIEARADACDTPGMVLYPHYNAGRVRIAKSLSILFYFAERTLEVRTYQAPIKRWNTLAGRPYGEYRRIEWDLDTPLGVTNVYFKPTPTGRDYEVSFSGQSTADCIVPPKVRYAMVIVNHYSDIGFYMGDDHSLAMQVKTLDNMREVREATATIHAWMDEMTAGQKRAH